MSEYHAGMEAGEQCILAEIERMADAAETQAEREILMSLLRHLQYQEA
jgi:hypothetical protein